MNLVIFTSHYPYGLGEAYLEEELRIAERIFDNILIVSYAKKSEKLDKYVPHNAKVIALRKNGNFISEYLILLKFVFCVRVWKELLKGCRERRFAKAKNIFKQILTTERHIAYLQRNELHWYNSFYTDNETVFYSYWFSSSALYLARFKQKSNGFCISRAHRGDCFFYSGFIPWREETIVNLDMIFPISEYGRLDILNHYINIVKDIPNKISVARLGVNLPKSINKKMQNKNQVTIVSCSSIIPRKRLDILIDALSLCYFVSIHWIHFGDGELMEQIKRYARKVLKKNKSITYDFFGRMPNKTILSYYSNNTIDIFVNCSDSEGIPVSAMEAMSYGIPVIARNVGGNAELINNKCGVLLPEKISPQELANAIKTVIYNEDGILYQERCINAYCQIKENYSAVKNHERFFEKIQRLLVQQDYLE